MTLTTLAELQQQDPDLANLMTEVFGDADLAAAWWTQPSLFGKKPPSQTYAEGGREQVLDRIYAIRYGFPA